MTPAITQTFGQVFHLSNTVYLIAFATLFILLNALGWFIYGRLLGAFFSLVCTIINSVIGLIPFWVALIGFFICVIEMGSYFWRMPEEKPDETSQKPPEVTGDFDKSQFNKRK